MENLEIATKVDKMIAQQEILINTAENLNKKDGWDKFSIVTAFISSVLLVAIGGVFTYFFQSQRVQRQIAQQAEQTKSDVHRNRLLELDAVSKFLPYLTDPDEERQKAAYLALNTLASTEVVTQLAKINPTKGATSALAAIATSPGYSTEARNMAGNALEQIFLANRSAVVKIREVAGGRLIESSGFFVTDDGYVVTADFSASTESDEVTIITLSGVRHVASVISSSAENEITVLKVNGVGGISHLSLSEEPPKIGDNILVIGSTGSEHLISALGKIRAVNEKYLQYSRKRNMVGFAGGPILDARGSVVGYHRGKASTNFSGDGEGRRLDKIKPYLTSLGISMP